MTDIRELRQLAGLSLQALAYKTGINRPKLSYAERGVEDLTAEERSRIIRVLRQAIEANAVAARRAEDKVLELARA